MKKILTLCAMTLLSYSAFCQEWQHINPTPLGNTNGNYRWQTGVVGDVGGNLYYHNTWLERNATNTSWYYVTLVDGISVDASFQTPTSSRMWWRRDILNQYYSWGDHVNTWMTLKSGKLGIGTMNPDEHLTVKGKIHAEEVRVDTSVPVPDYVFEKEYRLADLKTVEKYITENKHLPEVPSAKQIEKDGIVLGEMNMLLLKKIEELTLYIIEQQKQIDELKSKSK